VHNVRVYVPISPYKESVDICSILIQNIEIIIEIHFNLKKKMIVYCEERGVI
jgi:hypothetical protein